MKTREQMIEAARRYHNQHPPNISKYSSLTESVLALMADFAREQVEKAVAETNRKWREHILDAREEFGGLTGGDIAEEALDSVLERMEGK